MRAGGVGATGKGIVHGLVYRIEQGDCGRSLTRYSSWQPAPWSHPSDYQLAEGKSNEPTLASGHFLPLSEHPRIARNGL